MIEDGEIRDPFIGKTLHVAPEYDRDVEADIQEWFEKYYSIRWRNYPVDDSLSARVGARADEGLAHAQNRRALRSCAGRYGDTPKRRATLVDRAVQLPLRRHPSGRAK